MKILVTGGAGFIGSHIVDELLNRGHKVVVIDNLVRGKRENLAQKAKFYQVDICDHHNVEEIFKKERPDYVNHHAAQIDVRASVADPVQDARVNILGMLNILKNCIRYKVRKVIFASSGGVIYGDQESFPAPETHPTRPISPYGITKLIGERYLYYYKLSYGMEYVILRYGNVYGPRQDPFGEAGIVAIFTQRIIRNKKPTIYGDGKQTRDYVYVSDVVEANMLALGKGIRGVFNIGTGLETSVNEIFSFLKEIIGFPLKSISGPSRKGEQRRSLLDCRRARDELSWKAKIGLREGLGKTVTYFKKEGI